MRKVIYTISLFLICTLTANAQEATTSQGQKNDLTRHITDSIDNEPVKKKSDKDNFVGHLVEQMPSFPGGSAALIKFLSANMKYPPIAKENGIQGRVICSFVVEKDGSITDVKVAKSIDPSLDAEAMRVVKLMPKWYSGKLKGEAVRVKLTLPLTFRLPDPKPADKTQQNINQ